MYHPTFFTLFFLVVGTGTWVCFPVLEARKNEINQGVLEINPERLDGSRQRWQ